ncbi:ketol-acid reductoisomerase [bacterium]|nr:ketol-acid reductoisomerase [bacterium]
MEQVYTDRDVTEGLLDGKTVAILGYGSQGKAQAKNFRDSGVRTVLGLRPDGPSAREAEADGFTVLPFREAAVQGDIIHFLLPDEVHGAVYAEIEDAVTAGKMLSFSHGFSIHFQLIVPPAGVDVILVSPKAHASAVRERYLGGFGVPAVLAVHADSSGEAFEKALALAQANGNTRSGCYRTTFREETEADLFSEQNVICGGVTSLIRAGFDVLVEAGYSPEVAYFECVYEMKIIVDLIEKHGIHGMSERISPTARFGQFAQGDRVITEHTKEAMRDQLKRIQSGEFVREWIEEECEQAGGENLARRLADCHEWEVERVGRAIRARMANRG